MRLLAAGDWITYVFFGIMIVVVIAAIVAGNIQNSKAKKNLTEVAGRLGIAVTPDLRIAGIKRSCNNWSANRGSPRMELGIQGPVRGRTVRFSKFITGTGKSQQTWAELAVGARANSFTFSLRPENIGWKLVELFGFHEVKIGDEVFDQRWRINASDAATLRALLLPELRAKINEAAAKSSDFYLENDWIRYRELSAFSNDQLVARYEGMVGLMCDLAEAIEVAAENYRPPSPNSP